MEGRPVNPLAVQGERPLTPSFHSPRQGEMFEPISPVTSPRRTPRYGGIPMGMEPDRVAQFQEASRMIFNPAVAMVGGSFEPTEMPELTPEEMGTVPEMPSQGREQQRDSDITVRYSPVHTEEDISAKESTVGSPPPKKRKRKLSASERAASSSRAETVQKESGTKFVSKGKDIKNLQKAKARKRGVDEEDLHTPGKVKKKTHASSLYGELQRQEKASKAEVRKQAASVQEVKKPIVFGGKGRGKEGRRKGQPKKDAGKVRVTEGVQQRRLSWEDPAVIRALAGQPPPGAREDISQENTQSDSEGVVPHLGRIKRQNPPAQGAPQQVPQAENPIVQQAIQAGNQATQAKKQVNQPPRCYRKRPGTKALQEICKEQKSVKNLIPLAAFVRLVREIGQDFKADLRWQTLAVMALRDAAKMYLIGYFDDANMATIHAK